MSNIRTATLELTLNCNFHCGHCYIKTTPKGGDILESEEWIRGINRLLGIGCKEYILTGGEVLMSAAFPAVYRHLKSTGCRVDIFTNGSVLTQPLKNLFAIYPPDSVSVTLYGKSSEDYQEVTGCRGDMRGVVERNVATLKSMGIPVYLGTMLCKGLEANFTHGHESPIGSVEMNTYLIPALYGRENLKQRLSPAKILEMEINDPKRNDDNHRVYAALKPLGQNSEEYFRKCSGGHSSLFVSAKGLVSICAIYRVVSFNLLDVRTPMTEILKPLADVHENFRQLYFSGKCGACKLNLSCRNCPAYSLLETNLPNENPYLCELAKVRADHYLAPDVK